MSYKSNQNPARGLTVIELVVVMGIVAMAVSLFAPLVIKARQSVRQNECAANLRRIAQAWLEHEHSIGYLPSSGWGWRWTGDPDRGFGATQPGGWAFDTLRFTEYADVVNLGGNIVNDQEKAMAMLEANGTPISFLHCPDRRPVRPYPLARNSFLTNNLQECRTGSCVVNRTDYQANSGNIAAGETGGPSGSRSTTEIPRLFNERWNGVTFQISELRLSQIPDGLSKTICVGEKYLDPNNYLNGSDSADDNNAFIGIDRDVNGYTATSNAGLLEIINSAYLPRRDRPGLRLNWAFGGPHNSGFNAANCDSSVRFISYDVDHVVFFRMGGRNDGP